MNVPDERDGFVLDTDRGRLDVDRVVNWITRQSYWAVGRSPEEVRRSLEGSVTLGVYREGVQVACTRIVSDWATFAWICDVFVEEEFRGRGLGTWMVASAVALCESSGVSRVVLATRDAHAVYERVGFRPMAHPERWMEIDHRAPF